MIIHGKGDQIVPGLNLDGSMDIDDKLLKRIQKDRVGGPKITTVLGVTSEIIIASLFCYGCYQVLKDDKKKKEEMEAVEIQHVQRPRIKVGEDKPLVMPKYWKGA